MKMVRFSHMDIVDFKEFRGEHRIDFDKLGLGVHFIAGWNYVEPRLGSNGAGKSTIWDALVWCLYGKTVAGLKGPDVKTWGGKEHAFVRVMIESDEGEKALIVRSTKTNGLWIDGKLVEQAEIDRIIGMTYDIFLLAIVHGQGEALFLDLKPSVKMERLSEALDLDRWEARSAAARKAVQALDVKRAEMDGQIKELDRTAVAADAALVSMETQSAAWDADQAKIGRDNDKLLKEARKALAHAAGEMGNYDLALDGAETEARDTRKRKAKLEPQYQKCMGAVGAASAAMSVLMDERQRLANDDRPENCPTCGQKIGANKQHRQHIAARMKALDGEVEVARGVNSSCVLAAADLDKQIAKLAKELRGFEDKADDARDNLTRARSRHSEIEANIKALESAVVKYAMEQNPYSKMLKDAKTQLRRISGLQDDLEAMILAAEVKRERIAYWVPGFKNVRLYLLQEVLEELTAVTQTLLPRIGLEGWIVDYAMERETQAGKVLPGLNVNIFKPGAERAQKWESFSGGEGQRLRIVGSVALGQVLLRRVGVECDLCVLDEPTKHLSAEGVADMIDFLAELGRDHQVFYIDHTARPTNRFRKGLRIEKHPEGSLIVA